MAASSLARNSAMFAAAFVAAFLTFPNETLCQSTELGYNVPAQATASFPANFPPVRFQPLLDSQWGFPIGGWGGLCKSGGQTVSCLTGQPQTCTKNWRPVIFVHGNTRDASDWADQTQSCEGSTALISGGGVHQRFVAAGYCDAQLWAISYNGAAVSLCTSGASTSPHAADEINVSDLYRFINAVMAYTGKSRVDIVAHSLGVTIVRRMFFEFPQIRAQVGRFVAIDGANHGTTICRGEENIYYGCDEIAPGSYWLNQMNRCGSTVPGTPPEVAEATICAGSDEGMGVRTLVIHNDDGAGEDFFYLGADTSSPLLTGSEVTTMDFVGLSHDQLRMSDQTVSAYLEFLTAGQ